MLTSLPNELILHIIYQSCTYTSTDSRTLHSLSLVSRKLNKLMHDYRASIIDYYTVIEVYNKYTQYKFCGLPHRDNDLPAEIWDDGTQAWFQHSKLHRDNDLPAIIYTNGKQEWYQHGKCHRDNDQPAFICANGTRYWYKHNQLHRDNNQPALIFADGTVEYWINGERIPQ